MKPASLKQEPGVDLESGAAKSRAGWAKAGGFTFCVKGRRSQVAKAEVCKTFIQRFESARRLQPS